MSDRSVDVAIIGAGPAGLMLAHLLRREGLSTVNVDSRSEETIHRTHRAGILEHGSVEMLSHEDLGSRVLTEGHRHDGIDLRFGGQSHRVDFQALVGESVWLYPQNELFYDLSTAAHRHGMDVRYDVTEARPVDVESDRPGIYFVDDGEIPHEIRSRYVVGADGSRSTCRASIPEDLRRHYVSEYPFAWFGILTEAPPSAPELIYARSPHGFALISQRSADVQRMYFQCDPETDPDSWSDEDIWAELQKRVDGPDGLRLKTGPIFDKSVLKFRSFVCDPMHHKHLFLAGDAAHTVPPTGAKGLNLALADVGVLAPALAVAVRDKDERLLEEYSDTALARVWKAQNFSYWMTGMLHQEPDENEFIAARRLGELRAVVDSQHGKAFLAEQYTGWPDTPSSAI
ncbi:4-hydroxybenzoate 3-monooxygenase [Rothia uropygioeca]|uniref:4-hydroxybenzoate 3-monooxygenase n=1 Tax=Kocuria sp. 257 TaxID=2021970 RepID=UPI001012DEC6|nr:4-hydroxybenzoate 3-monooxygenase [Kocuria sp. 257]